MRLVTTGEAATRLALSPRALHRWARAGLVTPAFREPDGRDLWDVEDLRDQVTALPARFSAATAVRDPGTPGPPRGPDTPAR